MCFPSSSREGHVSVARLLLEAGADVETPDNYGQSPFFMACWKGHAVVAALLLEYDANKDCRTKTGITPLFQVRTTSLFFHTAICCGYVVEDNRALELTLYRITHNYNYFEAGNFRGFWGRLAKLTKI